MFFNLCASVQIAEGTLDIFFEELKNSTSETDQTRIRTNISAVKAARVSAINQYNANAAKSYTSGQFRASNLPYQLNVSDYDGKVKTQCAT